ncbi:MAG TPA: T9SS type A sorting domain-containing protein [Bacteroidia bacterium]|nr:T9SS type A sorting domain-containing protein [Bacteroidia bacterium]
MKRKFLFLLFIYLTQYGHSQILLSNIPNIVSDTLTNSVGYISAFEHDSATHKLYIAGEFERVGNVNRQGFAVIDVNTGTVLNDLNFITLNNISLSNRVKARLKLYNHRIYIGGTFSSSTGDYLFSVNLNNNNVRSIYNLAPLSDFEIYNSKIYASGAYYVATPDEFTVKEMDTLGIISWQKSIVYNTNDHLSCLGIRNNILFVGGVFTSFGGVSLNNIAKIDLSTHSITNWQPTPAPGPSGNVNCYDVLDMILYPSDVLLNISTNTCATPPNNIAGFSISNGALNSQIRKIPFNFGTETLIAENDTSFWYNNSGGLKLYGLKNYTASWAPVSNGYVNPFFRKAGYLFTGGDFTLLQGSAHKGLGEFCVELEAPKQQSVFAKACQGQTNLLYIVTTVKDAVSYAWSYTGTGVTINGTTTHAFMNFSSTATSGTLKVCAKSYCGATGDTLFIPFTVYPVPNISVGPDIRFTCSHNVDSLKGVSTTPNTTFAWYGPSYSNVAGAIHQVTTSIIGGNYILYITDPVSGCKSHDTTKIIFDTLAPVLNHNLSHQHITCKNSVVPLDASALYTVGNNLHWSGNSFSQNNPAIVTMPGIYTLTITSVTNDCINKDTFLIMQNITPPNISAPAILDTITCLLDSIQLAANSTSSNVILYWKDTNNDSLLNNSYIHLSGTYVAHALDTSNGCSNQLIRIANQFTTLPIVQLPSGNFNINCSAANVLLNGSSPNPDATLNWTGPNSFFSANPATTTLPGYYFLSVTNPQNGCVAKDSLQVILQNILLLNRSNDTTICNGTNATLSASPIGGTPGFIYLWNNGAGNTTITVAPTDTTKYIVTITDNVGCIGKDTITVFVPSPVSDSVHTFRPCDPNNPNGQIQAYGIGGIPPYEYLIGSGAFQTSGIFTGLNFGTYMLTIKDTLGCKYSFSSVIDQSSILPVPDFILSTSQTQGDTFVVVDISNPKPDSVHWILPSGCTIINTDLSAPKIINADTGIMQITMIAWFGTCEMQLTKNITVINPDTNIANSHNNNGIKNLILYPNPNTGRFTIDVILYKKQSFAIFIFDALGNEILRLPFFNSNAESAFINLNNPVPGSYILKVIAEYDSKIKTFLISQH